VQSSVTKGRVSRAALGSVLSLCIAGSLAACGSSASSSASPGTGASAGSLAGQSITIYSGQHEETTQALVADFEKRTGIKAKVKSDDEAALAGQLLQEGSASPADVFYAENPPALTTVQEKKLLSTVNASTLSQVPADASSPVKDWVGVSARTAAFAANKSVPSADLPQSVYDLVKPYWKGKLGLAPAETDFAPIVTEIIQSKGTAAAKAWLEGLKANGKVFADNETLIAAIDKGEIKGGLIDHYYWYRLRDEVGAGKLNTTLNYFATGDPGDFVDVSGAAVLASSKHQAAAQAFLAYLVSEPAQQIIATSHSYEYPLRPGVEPAAGQKPLADIGALTSPAKLGDGKPALALLQEVGLL
jgi:iron(III) transport system substrate-binding protein